MSIARALIVDDLAASRAWLRTAVKSAFPDVGLSEAATLKAAFAAIDTTPDLALVDLGLPDGSGVELIRALRVQHPATWCVVATVFDDDAHLFGALSAGAQGYVLKDASIDELATWLKGILNGAPPLSPTIARRLLMHFALPPEPAGERLTERESEVLTLIGKGFSVPNVAELLKLSRNTVAGYVKDVYRKLSISTRAEAAMEASRRGLVAR
jgi:DNA-binding NarL/FixJ family response regulator